MRPLPKPALEMGELPPQLPTHQPPHALAQRQPDSETSCDELVRMHTPDHSWCQSTVQIYKRLLLFLAQSEPPRGDRWGSACMEERLGLSRRHREWGVSLIKRLSQRLPPAQAPQTSSHVARAVGRTAATSVAIRVP